MKTALFFVVAIAASQASANPFACTNPNSAAGYLLEVGANWSTVKIYLKGPIGPTLVAQPDPTCEMAGQTLTCTTAGGAFGFEIDIQMSGSNPTTATVSELMYSQASVVESGIPCR